jgi:hypothetical protein
MHEDLEDNIETNSASWKSVLPYEVTYLGSDGPGRDLDVNSNGPTISLQAPCSRTN